MDKKYLRNFAVLVADLVAMVMICVANVVVLNVFSLVVGLVIVVGLCFMLGYTYSKYELARVESGGNECGKDEVTAEETEIVAMATEPKINDEDLNKL